MASLPRLALLVFRLAALVALAVGTALLIDYLRPLPAFCDIGSGCDRIRASGLGKVLGIPLPMVGVASFASLLVLTLLPHPRARALSRLAGVLGGLGGVGLLAVQFFVKTFCKLCLAVDVAAIVVGIAALFLLANAEQDAEVNAPSSTRAGLWSAATVVSVLIPLSWSLLQPAPPVPREVASRWVDGKINVVEFMDFECPFCRALHPNLLELLEEYGSRIHIVRLNMPLPQHPQSRDAARAYCCADKAGKASEMADALFKSDDLSPEACEKMAASLGIPAAEFRTCVRSKEIDARIDDEMQQIRSAGLAGLPTVWVNDQVIVGMRTDTLRDAFTRAANGKPTERMPTSLLWGVFAISLAFVGGLALKRRTSQETS